PPPTPPLFPYTTLFRSLHASAEIRSTSSSRKRSASTSTPARQLRVLSVTSQRSTAVRPSQYCDAVSISTLQVTVVTSVGSITSRSEEHTSELQSLAYLV